MKYTLIILPLILLFVSCKHFISCKHSLIPRDCSHGHICCDVGCYCCGFYRPNYSEKVFIDTTWFNHITSDYYVYNLSNDTIFFDPILHPHPELKINQQAVILDSIQVNGKGSKEYVFHRKLLATSSGHGRINHTDIASSSQSLEIEKYEIWDLDAKSVLFEVRNKQHAVFKMSSSEGIQSTCTCLFTRKIKMDSLGIITITKIDSIVETERNIAPPPYCGIYDKEPGTYQFINGKYEKVE